MKAYVVGSSSSKGGIYPEYLFVNADNATKYVNDKNYLDMLEIVEVELNIESGFHRLDDNWHILHILGFRAGMCAMIPVICFSDRLRAERYEREEKRIHPASTYEWDIVPLKDAEELDLV